MSELFLGIDRALEELRARYKDTFAAAETEAALREANARFLGKKGELTSLLKDLGKVPNEERRSIGEKVNKLKLEIEESAKQKLLAIARAKRQAELAGAPYDLTLPGRAPLRGHMHPISRVRQDVIGIFRDLGFAVHDGPEVEFEANNFEKLGFPPDHPATDMQDSFWTEDGLVLRTHTSNIQVRALMGQTPPFAFVAPGAVYRRDDDATHSPMFHQLEAFLVDEGVGFAHLRGILEEFAQRLYGPGTPVRLRPSYFPFVEPGAEVDVGCPFCVVASEPKAPKGKPAEEDDKPPVQVRAGCNVCKHTGWIEILGCGMIHPVVLENAGLDSERWTGFALGMGLERVAMVRYGIPNIKLFFDNDPRFLAQF